MVGAFSATIERDVLFDNLGAERHSGQGRVHRRGAMIGQPRHHAEMFGEPRNNPEVHRDIRCGISRGALQHRQRAAASSAETINRPCDILAGCSTCREQQRFSRLGEGVDQA
jgi:hypothetical protein